MTDKEKLNELNAKLKESALKIAEDRNEISKLIKDMSERQNEMLSCISDIRMVLKCGADLL